MLGAEGFELQAAERGLAAALFAVAELMGLARLLLADRFSFACARGFFFPMLSMMDILPGQNP